MTSKALFWFNGSVNEAIVKSKNERKLFVVFITGSDEVSVKMNALYESLSEKLSELPLVAIRLESQSDNCKLFSQIYPVIVIPSTYFIDSNGVAIEIIGGSVDDQNVLFEKIQKCIDVYKQSLSSNMTQTSPKTDDKPKNQEVSATSSKPIRESTPEKWSETAPSTSTSTSSVTTSADTVESSLDSKVERANQLIEAIRQKKAKEEEDNEKAAEIERRKGMKDMLTAKREREDKEARDAVNERERERREERLARERVLAQIAADKEERRARQMAFTESKTNESHDVKTDKKEQEVRQRVDTTARIQFRLPDGSTRTNVFEAIDTLDSVRQYVSSNLNVRAFTLSTPFPRREFGTNDYNETLRDLSLSPSSVLIVVPNSGHNSSRALTSQSIVWQFFTYLLSPFVMVWGFINSFLGSNSVNQSNQSEGTTDKKADPKTKQFYNRDGNIARMRGNKDDDSDDNSTYNGNSTQQM